MLIPQKDVQDALVQYGITTHGVLHIGAHECEELPFYETMLGISRTNIVWIDAIPEKVEQATARGIPNVYHAVITDRDDDKVTFHISNNVQSSSVLEFGSHAHHHPQVHYVQSIEQTTTTIDTFLQKRTLDAASYDFWNFDIQGAEMLALQGAPKALLFAKALYLEVNTEEVYKGCAQLPQLDDFLRTYGFSRIITHMTTCGWGDALYVKTAPPSVGAPPSAGTPPTVGTPPLSLCIPTMNRWSFLEKNLPHYLANPYIHEIVITDETGNDAYRIRETFNDPKLKVFINPKRLYAYQNKEEAVRRASNEWIVLIDSDNFAPLPYFEAWATYLQAHPLDPATVYAPSRTIPTNGHDGFDYRSLVGSPLTKTTYRELSSNSMLECAINTGNYIVHKDTYLKANDPVCADIYTQNIGIDVKLKTFFQLANGSMFVFPPGMEYEHIVHSGSLYIATMNELDKYGGRVDSLYRTFL